MDPPASTLASRPRSRPTKVASHATKVASHATKVARAWRGDGHGGAHDVGEASPIPLDTLDSVAALAAALAAAHLGAGAAGLPTAISGPAAAVVSSRCCAVDWPRHSSRLPCLFSAIATTTLLRPSVYGTWRCAGALSPRPSASPHPGVTKAVPRTHAEAIAPGCCSRGCAAVARAALPSVPPSASRCCCCAAAAADLWAVRAEAVGATAARTSPGWRLGLGQRRRDSTTVKSRVAVCRSIMAHVRCLLSRGPRRGGGGEARWRAGAGTANPGPRPRGAKRPKNFPACGGRGPPAAPAAGKVPRSAISLKSAT